MSSIGAVVAGLLILITGKAWADSVISFGIGMLLLYAALQIMKEAFAILLEEVPKNIDAKKVKESILALKHINGLDDLHIWTSGNNEVALSCHLIVEECSTRQASQIISEVKKLLKAQYGISHATIEPQVKTGPHDGESTEEGL
jgi:cobalt-zinc-cadmium efflux system protein